LSIISVGQEVSVGMMEGEKFFERKCFGKFEVNPPLESKEHGLTTLRAKEGSAFFTMRFLQIS